MEAYSLFETDLSELGKSLEDAECSVLGLLTEEDGLEDRLKEVDALNSSLDRLEQLGVLCLDTEAFVSRCKAMADVAGRAAKRVQEVRDRVGTRLMIEVEPHGEYVETDNFRFARRHNPYRVVVVDEGAIPEKYLYAPPTPPKKVDKNAIKRDLIGGHVNSIDGVVLDRGTRVEVGHR